MNKSPFVLDQCPEKIINARLFNQAMDCLSKLKSCLVTTIVVLFPFTVRSVPSVVEDGAALELQDVLQMAMSNNLDIQIEDLGPRIAQDALDAAWGEYVPLGFFEMSRQLNKKFTNTLEAVSNSDGQFIEFINDDDLYKVGFAGRSPWGTEYQIHTEVNVRDNSRNRQGAKPNFSSDLSEVTIDNTYSPEYETFYGFTLKQPFLRGFGPAMSMKRVREARINVGIAEYSRQIIVMNKMIEVTDAYYDLVFRQADLQVKKEAVRLAEQVLKENEQRMRLGKMAPIEVTEAQVKVSEAMEKVIIAEDELREKQITLLKLILAEFQASALPKFTVEELQEVEIPEFDRHTLIAAALEKRPDYLLAQKEKDKEMVSVAEFYNKRLPQLDASFTYGYNGFGGTIDQSYSESTEGETYRLGIGVNFTMPIWNKTGEAELIAAKRKKNQALLRIQKAELAIPVEVLKAIERVQGLKQRVTIAKDSIRLASDALEVEKARLEQGKTTTRNVFEFQDKLSEARTREVASKSELRKALNEVWAASGLLVSQLGFVYEHEEPIRHSIRSGPYVETPDRGEPIQPVENTESTFPFLRFGHRHER